jgi:hypothetical protein
MKLSMRWAGCSLINAIPITDPTGSLPFFLFHPAFHPRRGRLFLAGGANRPHVAADHRLFLSCAFALVMPQIDVAPSHSPAKHPICPPFPLADRVSRSLLLAVGAGQAVSTLSTARPRKLIWSPLDAKCTQSNLVEENGNPQSARL